MLAIFRRDLRSYAVTMTGWVFVAFILIFMGIYTMTYNLTGGYGNFEYVLAELKIVYLLAVPVLTMRCIAEERRSHTDQLLYALPLTSAKIVVGKYLALLVVLAVPLVLACAVPPALASFGDVYLPTAYLSIGAFFLMGAALTAIGMFISSLCESQVTAAASCFAVLLVNYFLTTLASYIPSDAVTAALVLTVLIVLAACGLTALTKNGVFSFGLAAVAEVALIVVAVVDSTALEGLIGTILSDLSLFARFDTFINGIVDLPSVVFYLAVSCVFVFLTVHSFDSRRWSA